MPAPPCGGVEAVRLWLWWCARVSVSSVSCCTGSDRCFPPLLLLFCPLLPLCPSLSVRLGLCLALALCLISMSFSLYASLACSVRV